MANGTAEKRLKAGEITQGPTIQPGPDPTFDPAGLAKGALHTKEQEETIRRKATSGRVISQEDL